MKQRNFWQPFENMLFLKHTTDREDAKAEKERKEKRIIEKNHHFFVISPSIISCLFGTNEAMTKASVFAPKRSVCWLQELPS